MTDPTEQPPTEDNRIAERIQENGKDLVWRLYESSASRHISLQRRDRSARKLALLLNPPGRSEEFEAQLVIAGGIFAERAACIAAVRTLQGTLAAEADVTRGVLDAAIKAIQARGPVKVAPEWETAEDPDIPETELFVATDDAPPPAPEGDEQ